MEDEFKFIQLVTFKDVMYALDDNGMIWKCDYLGVSNRLTWSLQEMDIDFPEDKKENTD